MLIAACRRQLRLAQLVPQLQLCTADCPSSSIETYRHLHSMVTTAEVEKVAAKPAWPITVDNISPNLVTAQYAGAPAGIGHEGVHPVMPFACIWQSLRAQLQANITV